MPTQPAPIAPPRAARELTLADYLGILRRRWLWVALPALLITHLATAWSMSQPDRFEATARVLLAPSAAGAAINDDITNQVSADRQLANAVAVAQSDESAAFVEARLSNTDSETDDAEISIETEPASNVIRFTASSPSADEAALIANTWAESFIDLRLTAARDSLTVAQTSMSGRIGELLTIDSAENTGDTDRLLARAELTALSGWVTKLNMHDQLVVDEAGQIIEQAQPPTAPTNTPLARTLVLGAIVGLIAGAGAALLRHNLDDTIETEADIAELGITVLGAIPKAPRSERTEALARSVVDHPGAPVSAAYRRAATLIATEAKLAGARSILVTSALANEGKTTSSANLAFAFAESGQIVALGGVDLRRPSIAQVFGLDRRREGIADVLVQNIDLDDTVTNVAVGDGWLAVVPAGSLPPNPSALLGSEAARRLVAEFEVEADMSVFDGPPVLAVADTLSFAPHVGGVLLVVEAGRTRRDDLTDAFASLAATGATVLGALVVGVGRAARHRDEPDSPAPRANRVIDLRDGVEGASTPVPSPSNTSGLDDPISR